jgi:hypothetical protein
MADHQPQPPVARIVDKTIVIADRVCVTDDLSDKIARHRDVDETLDRASIEVVNSAL